MMRKKMLAVLAGIVMVLTMIPAMAFAADEPEISNVSIGVGNAGEGALSYVSFTDGSSELALDYQTWLEGECETGKTIREAFNIDELSEPAFDGDIGAFAGWIITIPGSSDGENVILADDLSTDEMLDYVIPDNKTLEDMTVNLPNYEYAEHNLNIEAKWVMEDINGGNDDLSGLAVSADGGKLVIKDDMNGFNGEADCYNGDFLSPGPIKNAVSFEIVSAEKDGYAFSGWTVYQANTYELAHVEEDVALANGGCPPYGDPNLVFFLFDEYMDNGVKMHTYIGLWFSELVGTSMTTEELYSLGDNDKSYYAVANWTPVTVQETTVNGKPAKVEVAADITAVDSGVKAKYDSVDKIKAAMLQEMLKAGDGFAEDSAEVVYMDVTLKVKNADGVWETVTYENFPQDGVSILLPYPQGAASDKYDFVVSHMITAGSRAGEIEILDAVEEENGLRVTVTSLSPIAIAYQETVEEEPVAETESSGEAQTEAVTESAASDKSPKTGDETNLLIPAILMLASAATCAVIFRRRKA